MQAKKIKIKKISPPAMAPKATTQSVPDIPPQRVPNVTQDNEPEPSSLVAPNDEPAFPDSIAPPALHLYHKRHSITC